MEEWCVSMPKVELHAHLNGSIRASTLLELGNALNETQKHAINFSRMEHVIMKFDLSLTEQVFQLFDLIHTVITDHNIVTRVTKEVIEDFASDNVVYLELRTTPKRNDSLGMSKHSYIDAVIQGLKSVSSVDVDFIPKTEDSISLTNVKCNGNSRKRIIVRLILSIDRRETTEAAMETVKLALEMRHLGVVGIDLSGNPKTGDWITYLPALKFAREQGLMVTLHCGEIRNPEEIKNMLEFHPERIGHACFLEDEHWRRMNSSKIPVEICLTSNIKTFSVQSIDVHHFAYLYKEKYPLALCTDDTCVFTTTLSKEYKYAADSFGLGKWEMFELSRNAVEYIFADNGVKNDLRKYFNSVSMNMKV